MRGRDETPWERPCQVPPEAQPGHHVGWWHKWGHAGDAGGGQRFAPALKGETEAHGANGAHLAQGLIETQRGRMWPVRGCFVSALMARRGWGPPPSLSARVGRADLHSTGCCSLGMLCPQGIGVGEKAARGFPGMSPLAGADDQPSCCCPECPHEEGVLGQSWGSQGPQQLPKIKTHQHIPPNT